jgi:hypothetical protein
MCISNRVTILDENLIKSRDDHFERFWMLLKINGVKTALGVTYFPNDGTDKLKTDELFMNYLEMFPSFLLWGLKVEKTTVVVWTDKTTRRRALFIRLVIS